MESRFLFAAARTNLQRAIPFMHCGSANRMHGPDPQPAKHLK
jgi:hypothetical protein